MGDLHPRVLGSRVGRAGRQGFRNRDACLACDLMCRVFYSESRRQFFRGCPWRRRALSDNLFALFLSVLSVQNYVPTVFENYTASFEIDTQRIELSLWDTSGKSHRTAWGWGRASSRAPGCVAGLGTWRPAAPSARPRAPPALRRPPRTRPFPRDPEGPAGWESCPFWVG